MRGDERGGVDASCDGLRSDGWAWLRREVGFVDGHRRARRADRFAIVVPDEALAAALRVPERVRRLLRIEIYAVSESGGVRRQG